MTRQLSLRLRLLIAVGAISLVALGIADVVVYSQLRSNLYVQIDATLNTSHHAVESIADSATGSPDASFPDSGQSPAGQLPGGLNDQDQFCATGNHLAPGMYLEVRSRSGAVVTGSYGKEQCPAFQPGGVSYAPKLPATITGLSPEAGNRSELVSYFTAASTSAAGPAFRVRASTLQSGAILIVATPISSITSTLAHVRDVELVVSAGALFAAILLGLWLVRLGLRPLHDVERTAEAIAAGDLMHRVPDANPRTEVGRLAGAFNYMLERIETLVTDLRASESRLRRFVADASHELRTPIAAVSGYAQLVNQGVAVRDEDRQRAMAGIERESARMGRLVEDLLTLAKLDEHEGLQMEPVELVDVALEARETAKVVGPAWPVELVAADAVEVLGDRQTLRRVIDNLLANVRAHTPEGTRATISVAAQGGEAVVSVADDGPGISEQQAHAIFERFYRIDPSRARETGGAGLGLAIVASIVESHGGRVAASPRAGGGAVFTFSLPLLVEEEPSA